MSANFHYKIYFLKISVILSIFLLSKNTVAQNPTVINNITFLNQELQQPLNLGISQQATETTNLVIQKLKNYLSKLQIRDYSALKRSSNHNTMFNLPSNELLIQKQHKPLVKMNQHDGNVSRNPESTNTNRFGRELVLEDSRLYQDRHGICLRGKIRNNSRREIVNPVYAIADFIAKDNTYLGSRATRINTEPIDANETVSFTIFPPANISEIASAQLHFQGINTERKVNLYPTTNSSTNLSIRPGNCKK